jgi:hypothetical protein
MEKIKRLICEYDHPVLYIHLDGEISSGDLINFSYSMNRKLSKVSDSFYLFFDASNAQFNLMEGLAKKVFIPFFEDALGKDVVRVSVLLPNGLNGKYTLVKTDERVRFFFNDYSRALSWLSRSAVLAS